MKGAKTDASDPCRGVLKSRLRLVKATGAPRDEENTTTGHREPLGCGGLPSPRLAGVNLCEVLVRAARNRRDPRVRLTDSATCPFVGYRSNRLGHWSSTKSVHSTVALTNQPQGVAFREKTPGRGNRLAMQQLARMHRADHDGRAGRDA
jgi:hypothetical protein